MTSLLISSLLLVWRTGLLLLAVGCLSIPALSAGIVTDESSGQRQIPESVRADGSTRKAIKIRPGYRPPEDVEVYKNRTAETFRSRHKGGVIGAETAAAETPSETSAAAKTLCAR